MKDTKKADLTDFVAKWGAVLLASETPKKAVIIESRESIAAEHAQPFDQPDQKN